MIEIERLLTKLLAETTLIRVMLEASELTRKMDKLEAKIDALTVDSIKAKVAKKQGGKDA